MTVRGDVQFIRQKPVVAATATARPVLNTSIFIPPFSFVGGALTVSASGRYYVTQACKITGLIVSGEGGTTGQTSSIVVSVNGASTIGANLAGNATVAIQGQVVNINANDYLTCAALTTASHVGVVVQFVVTFPS